MLNDGDQGSCSVESIESLESAESDMTEQYEDNILDESLLDIQKHIEKVNGIT